MIQGIDTQHFMERIFHHFSDLANRHKLLDVDVSVVAEPLKPEEAIGHPERNDFPILVGREKMIEARVLDARGHAFTDAPSHFRGTLRDILLTLPLTNRDRAIFIATLNAITTHLGIAHKTVHCKDQEPELCAVEIAETLRERHGIHRIGLIGLNPAIAAHLIDIFGAENVRISDLNPDNIGTFRKGVRIENGASVDADAIIQASEIILLTGTCIVNGTFEPLLKKLLNANKIFYLYGVTCSGVCALADLPRLCPLGRPGYISL